MKIRTKGQRFESIGTLRESYSLNRLKVKINRQGGIMLVALVVTIVVLLILAGITIVYVFGDNGVFGKAKEAKDKTEQAKQDEQDYLGNVDNTINKYANGNGGGSGNGSGGTTNPPDQPEPVAPEKGEILTEDKTEYTDENGDKAIIPGGFCVVEDSKENPEDKNTVKDGLVISDVANDDLDNSKHGNQFVWIPVEDYSKFHLIEGYYNGSLDTMLSEPSNPVREAGDTTTAGSPGKPNSANSTAGSTESIAMYKSVKDNGGFYIARFEAGVAGTTASTTNRDTNKQTQDGSVKPVSQKGVGVWNFIPWGGTASDTASDNLPGNDSANGAVKVARSMYQNNGVHKVTSTLIYGVQWDAALNFIDSNYESGTSTGYVKDSTGKGNYTRSIATTGSNTNYQQKHIYDMAGNVTEWTMEVYRADIRVYRGGNYNHDGSRTPASFRFGGLPGIADVYIGLRLALYL